MKLHNKRSEKYGEGCLIGLMAWLFDWVSSLGRAKEELCLTRFARWQGPALKEIKTLRGLLPSPSNHLWSRHRRCLGSRSDGKNPNRCPTKKQRRSKPKMLASKLRF